MSDDPLEQTNRFLVESDFQSKDDGNNWTLLHDGLFSGVAFGELSGFDTSVYIRMKEGGIVRVTEQTGVKYLNEVKYTFFYFNESKKVNRNSKYKRRTGSFFVNFTIA